MKRVAVVPGSFDPVTLGHVDLACRAAEIFGSCEVVVMNNRDKTYRFSMEERLELCRKAFHPYSNIRVFSYEGMLYEYLNGRAEETVLVKGIRNETDYLYEKRMASYNLEHSGVETLYLDANEELSRISSTLVREKMDKNEEWNHLVSKEIVDCLKK